MYSTGSDYPQPDAMRGAPSPYTTMMQGSSAGNPAGGYVSSGGAQAGPWGTQAPTASYPNYPSAPQRWTPPGTPPAQGGSPSSGWPGGTISSQQGQQQQPGTSGWPSQQQTGQMPQPTQQQAVPQQVPPYTTNGYPQPLGAVTGYSKRALSGWDQTKWDDATYMSPKYILGRVMSKYAPSIQSAQQVAAEMARLIPGTSFDGQDLLSIPGVGNIDILAASHTDHPSWWYGDTSAPRPGAPQSQAQGPMAAQGPDPYAAMMQMLLQQQQPQAMPQQATPQHAQQDPAVAQLLTQLNTLLTEMKSGGGGRGNSPSFSFY